MLPAPADATFGAGAGAGSLEASAGVSAVVAGFSPVGTAGGAASPASRRARSTRICRIELAAMAQKYRDMLGEEEDE